MTYALLSIGSNVANAAGNPPSFLADTCRFFELWTRAVSSIYLTAPWGDVPQNDFYNAALLVHDPSAEPQDWLHRGQQCEQQAGRTREVHWGPRTLDVDVVACWDEDHHLLTVASGTLTVPHPYALQRDFVLLPAVEVMVPDYADWPFVQELQAGVDRLRAAAPTSSATAALTASPNNTAPNIAAPNIAAPTHQSNVRGDDA